MYLRSLACILATREVFHTCAHSVCIDNQRIAQFLCICALVTGPCKHAWYPGRFCIVHSTRPKQTWLSDCASVHLSLGRTHILGTWKCFAQLCVVWSISRTKANMTPEASHPCTRRVYINSIYTHGPCRSGSSCARISADTATQWEQPMGSAAGQHPH